MKKVATWIAIAFGILFGIQVLIGIIAGAVIAVQHPECFGAQVPLECAFK